MARAGCRAAFVGFETPLVELLREWRKGWHGTLKPEPYREVYQALDAEGILVFGFVVVGHPSEPADAVETILEQHTQWCDLPLINTLQPMKGTDEYDYFKDKGLLAKDMFYHDVRIPSIKGTHANLRLAYGKFARDLVSRFPRDLAAKKRALRRFTRHLYRYLLRELREVSLDSVADFRMLARAGDEDPAVVQERYVGEYLSGSHIERLAGLAS